MKFLKLEYIPLVVLILAVAQMASYADAGVFEMSYAVAGVFSLVSLATGVTLYLYLKGRDVTAARIAITTGVLFFVVLLAAGEYLFSTYFP